MMSGVLRIKRFLCSLFGHDLVYESSFYVGDNLVDSFYCTKCGFSKDMEVVF